MNKISMTSFLGILSASGPGKAKKVMEAKYPKPYSPASDYYKGIREAIVNVVYNGHGNETLDESVNRAYRNRTLHYKEVAQGFKKWWKKNDVESFTPPRGTFGSSNIQVNVNPEFSVVVGGVPHVLKLFFNKDRVTQNQLVISNYLMQSCFSQNYSPETKFSILDVRRSRIVESRVDTSKLGALVTGEMMCVESIWNSV